MSSVRPDPCHRGDARQAASGDDDGDGRDAWRRRCRPCSSARSRPTRRLNVIDGIAAISNSTFFTENARFLFSDLNTVGWIVLILGSCQVLGAFGFWAKTPGVRWFAVAVAALNGVAKLLFIPAYPFWSLTLFTLDILVIYGLMAHGKRSLT